MAAFMEVKHSFKVVARFVSKIIASMRSTLEKRIDLTQENKNKDILELERSLGHAVDDVT